MNMKDGSIQSHSFLSTGEQTQALSYAAGSCSCSCSCSCCCSSSS
ncbi:listeriolysin S family TOMM bacteriocin [Virgibacillus alimentarius]